MKFAMIPLFLACTALASAADAPAGDGEAVVTPYPLTTCIVRGKDLDDSAKTFVVDGKEIKTCCNGCMKKVKKDPAAFVAKLEEATAQNEAPTGME